MPTTPGNDAALIQRSGDAYRRCFGCGSENPIGLRLRFEAVDGGVVARFRPRPEYQGWDGMLHGGILLTMLDETLAYAALFAAGPAVTAELRARLRKPSLRCLDGLMRHMVSYGHSWYGFPGNDFRLAMRIAVDLFPEDEFVYDLTDLVFGGHY